MDISLKAHFETKKKQIFPNISYLKSFSYIKKSSEIQPLRVLRFGEEKKINDSNNEINLQGETIRSTFKQYN